MEMRSIQKELSSNSYPGRGIIIGKSPNGKYAVTAYFIMGRSVNSRNRIFERFDGGMRTKAFDESKLSEISVNVSTHSSSSKNSCANTTLFSISIA